ncbi:MAG: hypothetical protein ACYCSW_05390 [bacterium]
MVFYPKIKPHNANISLFYTNSDDKIKIGGIVILIPWNCDKKVWFYSKLNLILSTKCNIRGDRTIKIIGCPEIYAFRKNRFIEIMTGSGEIINLFPHSLK